MTNLTQCTDTESSFQSTKYEVEAMSNRVLCMIVTATMLMFAVHCAGAEEKPMQGEEPQKKEAPKRPARAFGVPGARIEVHSSVRGGFGGQSISRTTVNGVTKIEARKGREITRITDDPAEGVTVETSKSYDRSNMEELKQSHPNIYNYLEKAPQGMGPTKFRVTVEVAEVHQAKSADELKENHPEAFKIYKQYMERGGGLRFRAVPGIPPAGFERGRKRIEIKPVVPEKEKKPMARGEIET